jgi:hypothetical protein
MHKDGILFGLDSPSSVLFVVFCLVVGALQTTRKRAAMGLKPKNDKTRTKLFYVPK